MPQSGAEGTAEKDGVGIYEIQAGGGRGRSFGVKLVLPMGNPEPHNQALVDDLLLINEHY